VKAFFSQQVLFAVLKNATLLLKKKKKIQPLQLLITTAIAIKVKAQMVKPTKNYKIK
jgi:hypothetical protein